jgi:hypothetical protein
MGFYKDGFYERLKSLQRFTLEHISDLSSLTKGNLLTRIITSVVVIGILSLIFYAINN